MQRDDIERRREIEDQALELGSQRAQLHTGLSDNRNAISRLLEIAVSHGIPVEHFARLVGVRRASLYRWRAETDQGSTHNPKQDGGDNV